jgi:ADP-ribosyl-[dinitrogen reductase] hydrolase
VRIPKRQAIAGTILGGAAGDVLGGLAERTARMLSDDTQLTLATCEAIIAARAVTPDGIAAQMVAWFRAGRISGIGASTLKAMRDLAAGAHWALAGARGERAAGNGAAMRIAPLAFFLNPAIPSERTLIRDIARITHHNEEAYVGALAVLIAVRNAAAGRVLSPEILANDLPDSRVRDYLRRAGDLAPRPLSQIAREIGTSGFAPETVAMALTLVPRIVEAGFEAAIDELNELGGDTDTIASIAGQVAGAFLGSDRLPAHLLSGVPKADEVQIGRASCRERVSVYV